MHAIESYTVDKKTVTQCILYKLLLTYYLNIRVQAANLSDCRFESNRKNRFGSENRIESNRNFFCPNWNALAGGTLSNSAAATVGLAPPSVITSRPTRPLLLPMTNVVYSKVLNKPSWSVAYSSSPCATFRGQIGERCIAIRVCLCVCSHISGTAPTNFAKFSGQLSVARAFMAASEYVIHMHLGSSEQRQVCRYHCSSSCSMQAEATVVHLLKVTHQGQQGIWHRGVYPNW